MKKVALILALGVALLAPGGAGAETCISSACHADFTRLEHRHPPAGGGDCDSCHAWREEQAPAQRREHPRPKEKSFRLKGEVGGLCLGCHDGPSFKGSFVHGPVAEGACTFCHDPHGASRKGLLKDGVSKLCLSCHEDFQHAMDSAGQVHKPVREKPCTSCHDPHSSPFRYMLKKKLPDLCLDCHQPLAEKVAKSKVVHGPVGDKKSCSSCHSAHFSAQKSLLGAPDEASACLSCHSGSKLGKPPLRDMRQELQGKKVLHGPLRQGRCSACHDPHASDYPRLLAGNYPQDFYAPFRKESYSLCLSCHDPRMVEFAKTTLYTRFRDGSRNLHYLHVNGAKGRSCRACHESHASGGEKLIGSQGAAFGEWRVHSRFQPSKNGGSCAPGCHKPYSYDRSKKERQPPPGR